MINKIKQEIIKKWRKEIRDNGVSEETMEQFYDRCERLIDQAIDKSVKEVLEKLYSDLNFHHCYRSSYQSGSFDDGGHNAIERVQHYIVKFLQDIKEEK